MTDVGLQLKTIFSLSSFVDYFFNFSVSMSVFLGVKRDVAVVIGLSCSRIQLYSLSRQGSRETHLPPRVRVRSFSETPVCYASKDGTTKDGGDGGKVIS